MQFVVVGVIGVLVINAMVAFVIAFYWQARVILTLHAVSDRAQSFAPWKALANPRSPQNTFGRFFAGELFYDLRRKWLKALGYVAASFAALFVVAGIVRIMAPELLM